MWVGLPGGVKDNKEENYALAEAQYLYRSTPRLRWVSAPTGYP